MVLIAIVTVAYKPTLISMDVDGWWYTNNELVTAAFVNQRSHHVWGPHIVCLKRRNILGMWNPHWEKHHGYHGKSHTFSGWELRQVLQQGESKNRCSFLHDRSQACSPEAWFIMVYLGGIIYIYIYVIYIYIPYIYIYIYYIGKYYIYIYIYIMVYLRGKSSPLMAEAFRCSWIIVIYPDQGVMGSDLMAIRMVHGISWDLIFSWYLMWI